MGRPRLRRPTTHRRWLSREIRSALAQKLEFELELGDGRKARVTLTDGHGSFVLVSELS